jgi:hypothetical protein
MRSPILTVFLIALTTAAFAQRPIPKEVIQQLTADDSTCRTLPNDLKGTWIDLNNDRIPELIVKAEGVCNCGASGNCSHWVFQKTSVGYVTLVNGLNGQKLYSKNSVSNGFKDLATEEHLSATKTALIVHKWNGRAYIPSECFTKENISQTRTPIYRIKPDSCLPEEREPVAQQPTYQRPTYQTPTSQTSARLLTPQAFTVGAGRYVYFPIQSNGNAFVSGRFTATGGGGNDVEVFILGQDEFTNWQNRHSVNTWFNSGRVTVSNISVRLPAGNYYLVFSNNFSMMTPKAVTANVLLTQ